MILLAIPFGLVIQPGSVVAVLGLLVLIGLSVAPLSYAGGLCLKSEDAFAPLVNASPCRCCCCRGSSCRWRWRRTGSSS